MMMMMMKYYDHLIIYRVQIICTQLCGERGSGISVLPARHDDDDDVWYQEFLLNTNNYMVASDYFCLILLICLVSSNE